MARVCPLTGKGPSTGHNVSHSNRKTRRRFLPNLFWKNLTDPKTGRKFRVRLSTAALKNITKDPSLIGKLARKLLG